MLHLVEAVNTLKSTISCTFPEISSKNGARKEKVFSQRFGCS